MDTCTWVKYKCNLIVIVIINKKGMFNKPEDIETNLKACLFIYPRIIQGACTYYVLVVDDFHHCLYANSLRKCTIHTGICLVHCMGVLCFVIILGSAISALVNNFKHE